ncbi:MAG: hypothetical protein ACI3Y2_06410, partial [Candidatus Egerieousia sp.]
MNSKSLKIVKYALLIISVIVGVCFYVLNGDNNAMVSTILNWALVLIIAAIALVLVLPVFFRNGKGGKKNLLEFGLLAVLLILSYLFASGNEVALAGGVQMPSHSVLKWTDTLLILSILLLVVA